MNVNLTADNNEIVCTAFGLVNCVEKGFRAISPPNGNGWTLFGVEIDKGTHWVVCYWKRSKIDAQLDSETKQSAKQLGSGGGEGGFLVDIIPKLPEL